MSNRTINTEQYLTNLRVYNPKTIDSVSADVGEEIKVPNLPKNERNIDYLTDGEFGSIGRNSTSSNN